MSKRITEEQRVMDYATEGLPAKPKRTYTRKPNENAKADGGV